MALNISNEYSCTYKFQFALTLPINRRCDEIIALINECSLKDAHSLLPLLVESVFGFGSHPGWGIEHLFRPMQPRDFDTLRYFLCPTGPLMRFIHKLNNDAYLKYEFPTQCLPVPVQKTFPGGIVPPFYHNKFQAQSPGKLPAYLLLNPFEFYIFHLAYFLLGCQDNKRRIEWRHQEDCLYIHLVEDYFHYYLPCDGSMASVSQSPVQMRPTSPSSPTAVNCYNKSTESSAKQSGFRLFKQIPAAKPSSPCLTAKDLAQNELWRNELVAQTFIDLWLNHFTSDSYYNMVSPADKTQFFPSCVHVKLVRLFVKHIHYFANNSSPLTMNAFDEFKKAIVPQLLQKKLYVFIKHLFDHWPLDASFKLVLELWLSYIQPWRYVNIRASSQLSRENCEEIDRVVLSNWQSFVEENVMFYSIFFQKMVHRFLRVDLVSFKHANMLQRVFKVFSQPNLCQLIKVAESLLMESMFRLVPSSNVSNRSLLARAASEAGHAAIIRQHIVEMEGPNYNYIPMFGEAAYLQVKSLQCDINMAILTLRAGRQKASQAKSGLLGSISSSLKSFFLLDYDEVTSKADEGRILQFLHFGSSQISYLFQIDTPMNVGASGEIESLWNRSTSDFNNFDDSTLSDANLSINKGIEFLNKSRKPHMEYLGNPDLQIIRSYEIVPLVRILHQLSTFLNDQFALEIQHLYERNDFLGKISRQVIEPPRMCISYAYTGLPSPKHESVLPPRICLRSFAKQQNVGCLLALYLIAYAFGFNLLTVTFLFLFFAFAYLVFRAMMEPTTLTQSRLKQQPRSDLDQSAAQDFLGSGRREDQTDNPEMSD